jgi:branched-chain amino acid transport system permease protein
MGFNLQLLFTGIGVGSIYALVALGFALIYRATNVVNFAQGDFAMLGAFAMVVLSIDLELPYWLSILIALALLIAFGALFNLAVYYPLRNRSFLPVIISTIGASILLENGVLATYGPRPQTLDNMFDVPGFSIGDVFFDTQYIVILVVAVAMVALQYVFFERTLIGKKMQATSQDKEMASLLGIPVMTMIMITFMYSAMLGGLAGILVAPVLFVTVGMGSSIALKAFAASIIGGFGDVKGAIVGGLALGVIETFGAAYVSVPYKDAFAFLVLFAFLLVRPQGIYDEPISEKA